MKTWKNLILTFLYWLLPFLFWNTLFWFSYGIKGLCFALDSFALGLGYLMSGIMCLCVFFMSIKYLKMFYGVFVNALRVKKFNNFLYSLKCSFGVFGEQGVGKSLTMVYIIMLLQPTRYYDLMYEYYKTVPIKQQLLDLARQGNLFPWKLFKVRQDSVDFYYKNTDKIPCVYAFKEQQIKLGNRVSYDLRKEHFTQDKRLPESNMLACDEFGDLFNNSTRHKSTSGRKTDEELLAIQEVENTFKFASTHRQVSNGFMVLADQRKGDISIAFKGTCSKKWYLVSMEKMYSPLLLEKYQDKIKNSIVKLGNKLTALSADLEHNKKLIRLSKTDKALTKLIRKIGFYKIGYYEENGSEEVASLDKKEIKYYSIPCNLPFEYASRGYLLTDKTIDMPLSI